MDSSRVQRLSIAVLIALALAFVAAVQAGSGLGNQTSADEGRLGGDYPAFHAAGSIALAGDFHELYSAERQASEQAEFGLDGYLAFAYPPHMAVVYAPLAAIGFRAGYAVHTLLMVGALVGALTILRRPVPFIERNFLPVVAASLSFFPLFRAIGGGQNTALTVLVFASVWRLLDDEREVPAGLVLGLLWFRPQYVLPLLGLLFVARKFRAVGAAGAMAAITWLATALFMGAGWVTSWLDNVVPFIERDAEVNAGNSISVLGFLHALLGTNSTAANIVGLALAAAVVGTLLLLWRNHNELALGELVGIAAIGSLLISPHTMFYDAGLMVIAAAAVLSRPATTSWRPVRLVSIGWVAALIHPLAQSADVFTATPLALYVALAFGGMAMLMFNPDQEGELVTLSPRSTVNREAA